MSVSSFDPLFGSGGVWTQPLQGASGAAMTAGAYERGCGRAAGLFSTMGSPADPYPYYSVDLGGPVAATDVQLYFPSNGQAWPVGGVAVYLQPDAWAGNTSAPEAAPCFAYAGGAFAASVQGPCNATGRYVTVQLLGPTAPADTVRGASDAVLRICSLLLYGAWTLSPPPPARLAAGPAPPDQSRAVALSVVLPLFGCCLVYAALSAWLRARREREAAAAAAQAARAARAAPVPIWPSHHVMWSLRNADAWDRWVKEDGAKQPCPPSRGVMLADYSRQLLRAHASAF